jgi:GNAT superfamily N-acetyltransferase
MIRKAVPDDWDMISSISARAGYDDYINTQFGSSYLNAGNVYVHLSKKIDGFIKLEPLADRSLWFSGLRVDPESWRSHIATDLLNYGFEYAISNRYTSLRGMVETSNIPSIRLMESFGLSVVEKYFFFLGGIDISNYEKLNSYSGNYVNKDWKFDTVGEPVYFDDHRKVYLHSERLLYYTVLDGTDFTYTDNGTTCAPENISQFIKLKPDLDFNSGYVFEKKTPAIIDNL